MDDLGVPHYGNPIMETPLWKPQLKILEPHQSAPTWGDVDCWPGSCSSSKLGFRFQRPYCHKGFFRYLQRSLREYLNAWLRDLELDSPLTDRCGIPGTPPKESLWNAWYHLISICGYGSKLSAKTKTHVSHIALVFLISERKFCLECEACTNYVFFPERGWQPIPLNFVLKKVFLPAKRIWLPSPKLTQVGVERLVSAKIRLFSGPTWIWDNLGGYHDFPKRTDSLLQISLHFLHHFQPTGRFDGQLHHWAGKHRLMTR